MRLWHRLLLALILPAVGAAAIWGYASRDRLIRQWMAYCVGTAAGYEEACRVLAWFEAGPDRDQRLHELIGRWGGGNPKFDLYVARFVGSPESSEAMRKNFSLGLAGRERLLPRWAHWWCWRGTAGPDRQAEEILAYIDLLDKAKDLPREITWREILDLQAIFHLTGQPNLAERLQPSNWRDRYRQWRKSRPAGPIRLERPAKPLPDWEGPIPP